MLKTQTQMYTKYFTHNNNMFFTKKIMYNYWVDLSGVLQVFISMSSSVTSLTIEKCLEGSSFTDLIQQGHDTLHNDAKKKTTPNL